jgi:hypothetical protein
MPIHDEEVPTFLQLVIKRLDSNAHILVNKAQLCLAFH